MRNSLHVSSFYKFFPIEAEELAVKKLSLEARAARHEVRGLLIIATEGVNGTISGSFEAVRFFEQSLPILFGNADWEFKRGYAITQPFRDFRVKVRTEICTTRRPVAVSGFENRLSPVEWEKVLSSGEEFSLIDTRNEYETALGMFESAIDPKIENFTEFPAAVERLGIPRDKKVLMYCTGGIRCEKASVSMQQLGYSSVYQLDGGILNYLEQFPHHRFHGECFVFDGRVAVDQNLNPTRTWKFCPHCGQPGREPIDCDFCGKAAVICETCLRHPERLTCSHDCRYKAQHHPSRIAVNS